MTAHKLSIGLFAGLGLALLGGAWAATGSVEAAGARSHRAGDAPAGSGSEHRAPAPAPAPAPDKKAKKKLPPPGPRTFHGRVSFKGKVPPPRKIKIDKDPDACEHAGSEVRDVVVSDKGGLAGVIVEVLGVKKDGGWKWDHPKDGYTLRQKNCRLWPHVQIVPDGSKITLINEDSVIHNINTGDWNVAQAAGSTPIKKTVKYGGRPFIKVRCNFHSWMQSYIYVPRSPFYAVTDSDGKFRMDKVPAGEYKVTAYHPTLGRRKGDIKVTTDGAVKLDFEFKKKKKRRRR